MHYLVPDPILENYQQQQYEGAFPTVALFTDVSGFTPLTQVLMDHGKEGAEVLANILSAIFTPLIQQIYQHDGFIAFFAGDAFVALFPGYDEGSYQRALLAAHKIQQHMIAKSDYQTPYGIFEFSVKTSLADGLVDWGIWRGEEAAGTFKGQRCASYFTGEAIDRCFWAEQFAHAGEIIISQAIYQTLSRTPPLSITVEPVSTNGEPAILRVVDLQSTGLTPESGQSEMMSIQAGQFSHRYQDVDQIAARFFSSELLQLPIQGEFRSVVSIFINLQKMPHLDQDKPFIDSFFRLLNQYDGYLCRVGRIGSRDAGATLLLFWGAPTSHENDVSRALSFLLDLKAEAVISFRAGVTFYTVYAGFIGSPLREEYTCHGIGVNLAARQMVTAPWGEIWLDGETARLSGNQFEITAAGHILFKGFAQKRPIFNLVGRREKDFSGIYRGALVGREEELKRLHLAIQPIFSGQFAGVTLVKGEAGVGKSRLLYEFRQTLLTMNDLNIEQAPVWFHCPADEIMRQSLNPFRYFLKRYFDQKSSQTEAENQLHFEEKLQRLSSQVSMPELRQELARIRSFLGALVGLYWPGSLYELLEPQLRFENSLSALKTLLIAVSLQQPVVIELEDLHWFDSDSIKFLHYLVRNSSDYPLALIGTSRNEIEQNRFEDGVVRQVIPLQSFSTLEMRQFIIERLADRILPNLLAILMERTQGNPLFLEQMLLYLEEKGLAEEDIDSDSRDIQDLIPIDARAVLVARLDELPSEVKELVQTAAILGREFVTTILFKMLEDNPQAVVRLQYAAKQGFWSALSEFLYLFRHILMRDAAYDVQLQARRRKLHRAAAEAIEQIYRGNLRPHYADLAYHYDRAELPQEATSWYRLAGEEAADQYDNEAAVNYFSRALELVSDKDQIERYELLLERQRIYDVMGQREAQEQDLAALRTVAEALQDKERLVAATYQRAIFYWKTGKLMQAQDEADSGAERAKKVGNRGYQSAFLAVQGRIARDLGRYAEAEALVLEAQALYHAAGDQMEEAAMVDLLGGLAWQQGDYIAAVASHQAAANLFGQRGNLFREVGALNNLGSAFWGLGDYVKAIAAHRRGAALSREIGYKQSEGDNLDNMGGAYWALGGYSTAIDYYRQALDIRRKSDDLWGIAISLNNLGTAHRSLAEFEAALTHYIEALAVDQKMERQRGEAYNLHGLGMTYLAMETYDQAEAALTKALALRRNLGETHLAMESLAGLAALALAQGQLSRAQNQVEEILEYLKTHALLGAAEPFQVYMSCYKVLVASQDARASSLLETAHSRLQEQAAKIEDETLRRSYLENVRVHRQILDEVKTQGLSTAPQSR